MLDRKVDQTRGADGARLKYGLYLPNVGNFGRPGSLLSLAGTAWSHEWDGCFVWDHLVFGGEETADPQVTLGAMAQASRGWPKAASRASSNSFTIGALVTPVARRRAWKLAKEIATIASLIEHDPRAPGLELIWGFGLGADLDYVVTGEPDLSLIERAGMTDNGIALVRKLLGGSVADFVPPALAVPLWSAMSWKAGVELKNCPFGPLRRAAGLDGVFPVPDRWPDPWDSACEIGADQIGQLADRLDSIANAATHCGSGRTREIATCGRSSELTKEEITERDNDLSAAGATWWLEVVSPTDCPANVEQMVAKGPKLLGRGPGAVGA